MTSRRRQVPTTVGEGGGRQIIRHELPHASCMPRMWWVTLLYIDEVKSLRVH
jgi:hypothetical protein